MYYELESISTVEPLLLAEPSFSSDPNINLPLAALNISDVRIEELV